MSTSVAGQGNRNTFRIVLRDKEFQLFVITLILDSSGPSGQIWLNIYEIRNINTSHYIAKYQLTWVKTLISIKAFCISSSTLSM